MWLFTDPTYLRTIHDGLVTGSVNKDNASALPYGLVGVYEEAMPPLTNAADRQKFNEFFAVWALLKKEVSTGFIVPLLAGWAEDQVIGYIARYSKWFNSPVSGMYVLYHERLRTFVLQKISQDHLSRCNHALIQQCSLALQSKSGDEWERYALQHLSIHLLIQAMDSKDDASLKALAYDTAHWNRQVEISKGFEWSKRMLNDMMLSASKYDDDEVIECALNKVDLYHMEQNDAPRIVELVAQNDFETALQRIESFGGNDQEGLQRRFILYMLCLMELTLLDSKNKPFRKEVVEKLLKNLDDYLRDGHLIMNLKDIFPSYLMFLMACEWSKMDLDYLFIYDYIEDPDFEWLNDSIRLKYNSGILLDITNRIRLNKDKHENQADQERIMVNKDSIFWSGHQANLRLRELQKNDKNIAIEFAKKGQINKALKYVEKNVTGWFPDLEKVDTLSKISTEFFYQGNSDVVNHVLSYAQSKIIKSQFAREKYLMLQKFADELSKQKKFSRAKEIMFVLIKSNTLNQLDEVDLNHSLINLYNTAGQKGELNQAISIAMLISDVEIRRNELMKIHQILTKDKNFLKAKKLLEIGGIQDEKKEAKMENKPKKRSHIHKVTQPEKMTKKYIVELIENFENKDEKSDFFLKDIACEAAKNGWVDLLEIITEKIKNKENFSNCWREIANIIIRGDNGYVTALNFLDSLKGTEAKFHFKAYVLSWMSQKAINPCDLEVNRELALKVSISREKEILKHILYSYSLNELFFGKVSNKMLARFKCTLNIQWAIDIKNSIKEI